MEKQKSQSHHQTVRLALFLLHEYYFLDNDVIIIRDSYSGEEAGTHPATLSYYQAVADNQGSIIAVFDNNLNRVFEASYDAWGKQTVTLDEIDQHHGYTEYEMLWNRRGVKQKPAKHF